MTRETRRKISTVIRYTLLILVGIIMVYPLIWMVGATFKTNSEIFTSAWFIPKNPVFDGYDNAFKSYGGKIDLVKSLINTLFRRLSLPLYPQRSQHMALDVSTLKERTSFLHC